jgi:phosphatidylserine/phosphatidylglycerophosphate/cardiolipin synthase-like enzyme
MRKTVLMASFLALLLVGLAAMPKPAAEEAGIAVYFSPDGGCLDAVASVIHSAKKTLDVQAYILTTKELLEPIKAAHERGVKVRVLMDSDNAVAQYSGATYLANAKVPVWTDAEHKEAHNKVILADAGTPQAVLLTGSFNFTQAADRLNAENVLILTGKPKLTAAYAANFEAHLKHAKPYTGIADSKPDAKPKADARDPAPAGGAGNVYATANGGDYSRLLRKSA